MKTELQKLIEESMMRINNDEMAMQRIEKNGEDTLLNILIEDVQNHSQWHYCDYDMMEYIVNDTIGANFVVIATVWKKDDDVELYMMGKMPDEIFPEMVERIALGNGCY